MASVGPDYVSSDCAIAGRHIKQGIRDGALDQGGPDQGAGEKQHPLTLIRIAYGL